jgi:hypothetical protein
MSSSQNLATHALAALAGLAVGVLAFTALSRPKNEVESEYTTPNQPLRFAKAKAANNTRVLNIDAVYNPSYVKGKTILVTGINRHLIFFYLFIF